MEQLEHQEAQNDLAQSDANKTLPDKMVKIKSKLANIPLNPFTYINKAKNIVVNFFTNLMVKLTLSQKLYLAAFISLIYAIDTNDETVSTTSIAGTVALIGLFSEVWPKFVKVWESLLGRIFLVLFYAIIANLAVAFSAQKVNQVIGVDPSSLFYTLGFTTVLLAPLWFLGVTVVFMVLYMVFLQLWLITVFLLKLIRVPIYKDPRKFKNTYPILTNIGRIILLPIMVMTLFSITELYVGEIKYGNSGIFANKEKENSKSTEQLIKDLDNKIKELEASGQDVNEILKQELLSVQSNTNDDVQLSDDLMVLLKQKGSESYAEKYSTQESAEEQQRKISKLIAWFVYEVETFERSQCEKQENERAMYIGESDILISSKNPDAEFGYDFKVKTCQLVHR